MTSLDGILKLTDSELNSMASSGKFRSRDDVELTYKLIDIAKDIYCIWAYEEGGYSEESYDGGSYRGGRSSRSYERGGSYDDMSYARRGGRSREGSREGMSRRGSRNSYRGGYSRDSKQEFLEELKELMEDAPDEQTRQSIQRMMQEMGM